MKKKIYALMLVVAMVATTLVGCGSEATDANDSGGNVAQTPENGANQEGADAFEADGTFQISFQYEIPYEFTAEEQYITRNIYICLYDNEGNTVLGRTLYQDFASYSVENQELVRYELYEYDTSNTTLFELRDTLLAERDILSDYYSAIEGAIEEWENPDAQSYVERWADADVVGMQSFLLENVTIHLNPDRMTYYLNSSGGSGDFPNEPVIPYATLEDGSTEVAYAITYCIFGEYSCEGDLTATQIYQEDYASGLNAEPINTVVLVDAYAEDEEELPETPQEQQYANVEVRVFEGAPANGMAIAQTAAFVHADDETQATVEVTVVYADGWEFIYRFDGEESMGLRAQSDDAGSSAFIYNDDKTALIQVWGAGTIYQEIFDSYMEKDLRASVESVASVDVNEYYEEIKTDTQIAVIAAASEMTDGVQYKGFYKMILDMDTGMAAFFRYLAPEEQYDEQVAYDTIYSIEFVNPSESLSTQYID